jgi:DNA-directed RNA polymerase subunit F
MIKERKVLTLSEVETILNKTKENDKSKSLLAFIKKFKKTEVESVEKLKEELKRLDLIKLKDMDLAKIIDFLPENVVELNKCAQGSNLDSEEINKVLEVVKNSK